MWGVVLVTKLQINKTTDHNRFKNSAATGRSPENNHLYHYKSGRWGGGGGFWWGGGGGGEGNRGWIK